MAARAIWKAVLHLGDASVPVKLYSAVEDRGVHFRLLHAKDRVPVEQKMVHPGTGEPVPYEEIRRGWEAEPGTFVVLDDEDLAAAEPEASRDVEITRFVPPETIDHRWYDRPYFLGPDGDGTAYAALARALADSGREGVARWTMRKKSYLGALVPEDGRLALVTLRPAAAVISAEELDAPSGRTLEAREKKMARQLVAALAGDDDLSAFRDEYRERVLELVAAKAEGKAAEVRSIRRKKAPEGSLADVLEASLAEAKGAAGRRKSA